MLVLSRAAGQSVVLDDRIVVTVLASRPGIVRIGIEAPEGVVVRRGELERADPMPAGRVVESPGPDALGAGTRTSEG